MPALKQSGSRRCCSGIHDAQLRQAIAYFFQLHRSAYMEMHPECIIPSAGEFLGYVFKLNLAIAKHKPGATPIGTKDIEDFIVYLTPTNTGTTIHSRILRCILIVSHSVLVWFFVNDYFKRTSESPMQSISAIKHTLQTDTGSIVFIPIVRCFVLNSLPIFKDYKDGVVSQMQVYMRKIVSASLLRNFTPPTHCDLIHVGKTVLGGLELHTASAYKHYIYTPFRGLLQHLGYFRRI